MVSGTKNIYFFAFNLEEGGPYSFPCKGGSKSRGKFFNKADPM
jgi:hypothetical protein